MPYRVNYGLQETCEFAPVEEPIVHDKGLLPFNSSFEVSLENPQVPDMAFVHYGVP